MIISTIHTGSLRLAPFSDHHLTDTYIGWLNDKNIMRYSEQRHIEHTLDSAKAYIATMKSRRNDIWAIEVLSQKNRHIGNITCCYDYNNAIAEVGIMIGSRCCQGKGYGSIAWNAVLKWLEKKSDLRKITAGCLATNSPMVQIMKSSGMVPDGTRSQHYLFEGNPVDIMYFAKYSQ